MTMLDKLDEWGPMTVLMITVAVIAMGVGGAVVIVNPDTLTFQQYLDDLKTFAIAAAGLAGARGILGAGKHIADANVQSAAIATSSAQPDLELDDEDLAFDELDDDELEDVDIPEVDTDENDHGERPESGVVPDSPHTP